MAARCAAFSTGISSAMSAPGDPDYVPKRALTFSSANVG